jgi:hypothetical protein
MFFALKSENPELMADLGYALGLMGRLAVEPLSRPLVIKTLKSG